METTNDTAPPGDSNEPQVSSPAPPSNGASTDVKFNSSHVVWFGGCIILALAMVAQGEGFSKSPRVFVDELSAEHVVPPPTARNDVCTIQFCQS